MASKIREGKRMKPVFIYGDYRPDYMVIKVIIRHGYSDAEIDLFHTFSEFTVYSSGYAD